MKEGFIASEKRIELSHPRADRLGELRHPRPDSRQFLSPMQWVSIRCFCCQI